MTLKIKTSFSKGNNPQSEKATSRLGKIFVNNISGKELISRTHKDSYLSITIIKNSNNLIKNHISPKKMH